MNRRHFLNTSASLLSVAPFAGLFARDYRPAADPAFELIRGNVGYYTNRGGTIGVYLPGGLPEGGVVVDTQFPAAAEQLLEMLKKKGELSELALLINTHHHGDHTSGNSIFSALADNHVSHARAKQNLADNLAKNNKTGSVPLPRETFDTAWSTNLPDGKETISLRHFGHAHTGGDAVIHFENANVAHVGDLLFNRRFPYIDPGAGGDILNWAKVMKQIRKTYDKNTIYIFGHAAEDYPVFGTASDIKAFENYLKSLHKYVRKEKKKGSSLENLVQKTVTIPGAPEWSAGERQRELNLRVMFEAL